MAAAQPWAHLAQACALIPDCQAAGAKGNSWRLRACVPTASGCTKQGHLAAAHQVMQATAWVALSRVSLQASSGAVLL